jgi:hypothetical protein
VSREYVPIECGWIWHPKVIGLSLAARGLWISGLCYAGTNDGVITYAVVERFAPRLKLDRLIDELESAGLWDKHPIGWVPHDFEEHCQWLSQRRERDRLRQQKRRQSLAPRPVTPTRLSRDSHADVTLEREQRTENKEQLTPRPPSGDVAAVWETWLKSTGRTTCKLDEKRKRVIAARLKDYPLDDVLAAVQGWERDPWEGRRQQNEVAILLRDNAHLEKFRDLWRQPAVLAQAVGGHVDYEGPSELARKFW